MLRTEYPELEKPVFCAEKMSWLEKRRNIQFHKNLMKIDRRQILLQERIEGRAEGLAEGRTEGIVEVARKMKEAGDSIEKIHTITGLSVDEVEKL